MKKVIFISLYFFSILLCAQDISLYRQFNGHVDFTMIGNTLNLVENENNANCAILTSATASLNIGANNTIEAAYLYWAGSGLGDFDIRLNNENLTAQRTFSTNYFSYDFFSVFYDVTSQVASLGNGNYTLSNLDLNTIIPNYCSSGINFGGWAIVIIYANDNLPENQINVYDGLQSVLPNDVTIQLDNLNVIDNTGAQIGFLAWEGDSALAVNETLSVNDNAIESLPLNPVDNAFNGTNSFTGETNLYNMDLDLYNIEDFINIGDTSATIKLTSGQDYVILNCIVTKLNSQLPDATIQIDNYEINNCNQRLITVDYTVFNSLNATNYLPNIPISFYAFNGIDTYYLETIYTNENIAVNDSISLNIELEIPASFQNNFEIIAVADDLGNGNDTIIELDELNNESVFQIQLPELPIINIPESLSACNNGFKKSIFNLEASLNEISTNINFVYSVYASESDLSSNENEILNISEYENHSNPQKLYIKVYDTSTGCYSVTELELNITYCPSTTPQLLPPNTTFNLDTLFQIYPNAEIKIFNRYGSIVYNGNKNTKNWNGTYNNKKLPSATYFYSIKLNDGYFKFANGWIYLLN